MRSPTLAGVAIVIVAALALLWGVMVGREPVPQRPRDLTAAVDGAWYAALALDAAAATAAYLGRIPSDMRVRGEAYGDSRLRAFVFRVLALIAATVLLCAAGFGARLRGLAARALRARVATDTAVALGHFVALCSRSGAPFPPRRPMPYRASTNGRRTCTA